MPSFLIALVLMILFCFRQRWFPYTGLNSAGVAPGTATYLLDRMRHLILPVLTLTIAAAPSRYLLMRNTVSQVTEEKYVLYLMAQKDIVSKRTETSKLKTAIESGKRRIQDLDKLIERIYEDQVLGNISAERYARMSVNYENGQRTLINKVAEDEIKSLMAKSKQTRRNTGLPPEKEKTVQPRLWGYTVSLPQNILMGGWLIPHPFLRIAS